MTYYKRIKPMGYDSTDFLAQRNTDQACVMPLNSCDVWYEGTDFSMWVEVLDVAQVPDEVKQAAWARASEPVDDVPF